MYTASFPKKCLTYKACTKYQYFSPKYLFLDGLKVSLSVNTQYPTDDTDRMGFNCLS